MYKNLLDSPNGEPLFIRYIPDEQLLKKLSGIGLEEGASIIKINPLKKISSDGPIKEVVIIQSEKGQQLIVSSDEAENIFVSACDACWSCGNCMDD